MAEVVEDVKCYHCGQSCTEEVLEMDEKQFCCFGCQTVYQILAENDLCEYYTYDKNAGINLRYVSEESYGYLDEASVRKKILEFDSESFARVQFFVPAIHCISCLWLLENLKRIDPAIVKSEVNFAKKIVRIDFNPSLIKLSKLARTMASLGYAPQINLESTRVENTQPSVKALVAKLAIAGFCFGNIMLFSFPEYLGLDAQDASLRVVFSWLNILLAIPVLVYSAQDYFSAAWKSFAQKQINIDVPIAVGLVALFFRSFYDIISATGPGYMDSFSGLVFFLLIGRWFQSKTYESLAFDRDYKSYFPLAVNRLENEEWKPVVIYEIKKGDRLKIRSMEIIPADSILLDEEAFVDYSFVTGESRPVNINRGGFIYAGGRLVGRPVEMIVEKETSQSHLTSLWNDGAFAKPEESKYKKLIDLAARRFTWVVLGIALLTAVVWYILEPGQMWLVLTSVLMVACPCALALAAPFTYGSMLRVFGKQGFYLKNADVIERLGTVDAIVFDKTGTVTHGAGKIKFVGTLEEEEYAAIRLLTSASTHPLSNLISRSLSASCNKPIDGFREIPGNGIEGIIGNVLFKVGSAAFVGHAGEVDDPSAKVFVSLAGKVRGYFEIETTMRNSIGQLVSRLGNQVVALLSGDHDSDRARMQTVFGASTQLLFDQSPHDKLHFVSDVQKTGKKVMMIGDGLNDSGALKQSDVGIALSDDQGVFTPACDGILTGNRLVDLDKFLALSKKATGILKTGFVVSFFYNLVALSVAVSGNLTPLVAAILMPISSISVVILTTWAVNHNAAKLFSTVKITP